MKKLSVHLFFLIILVLSFFHHVQGQQLKLGSNPTQIDRSAALQIDSKNQGVLLPRLSDTTEISLMTPPDGMVIYWTDGGDVDVNSTHGPKAGLYIRKGGWWQPLVVANDIGIVSLNTDKTAAQTLAAKYSGSYTNPTYEDGPGNHTLNLPYAGTGIAGAVSTNHQYFDGVKVFNASPGILPLTSGAIPFIGSGADHTLSQSPNLFWDNTNHFLGIGTNSPQNSLEIKSSSGDGTSGLTFTNLTSSNTVSDQTAKAIGVNSSGQVVRVNTPPTYYRSNGQVLSSQVKKIVVDSILSTSSPTVAEIRDIDISAVGFTKILSIQLTGQIIDGTSNPRIFSIIPSILSYTVSQIRIRVLELQIGTEGLLSKVIGTLAGNAFQVPSTGGILLGLGNTDAPKPYVIYYRIEGY